MLDVDPAASEIVTPILWRLRMKRTLLISISLAAVLPFLVAGPVQHASGKGLKVTNRFAPSGAVSFDPAMHPARPVTGKKPAVPPSGTGSGGCPDASATNVRANQECTSQSRSDLLGRSQSQNETAVAVNPTDANNVLITQNDYRKGDAKCGVNWSLDGGQHFGSQILQTDFTAPGFTNPRHYWQANGDTSVGFDSQGVAYVMCQVFDRGATADGGVGLFGPSGFLLFRSFDGGASWQFPGSIVTATDATGGDGIGLLDKEYMTIDSNPDSPYADRIYVAWAQYPTDFASSPTYFAYSDDRGQTWHQSGNINGFSADLCPINFSGAAEGTCDASQFNDPFVAPNGDVYDVMVNFNNCSGSLREFGFDCPGPRRDNHNQILIVKSTDGGNTFSDPVKVSNFYDLPDCFEYLSSNFGRACVPTAPLSPTSVFRATNYPSGVAISDTHIEVDFGSYINRDSNPRKGNCSPNGLSGSTFLNLYTGVGDVNGCNNDIVRSRSNNGGASFTGTSKNVAKLPTTSQETGAVLADQWWQWTVANFIGGTDTSYYDRSYGADQSTGYLDFSLAITGGGVTRVTDFSTPPSNEFPDANGYSTFIGDYTGLAIGFDGMVHPAWADTRNPIYTYSDTDGHLIFAGYGADIYTRALSSEAKK
jgi:hypothetical protein